jgi:hypothetical protein
MFFFPGGMTRIEFSSHQEVKRRESGLAAVCLYFTGRLAAVASIKPSDICSGCITPKLEYNLGEITLFIVSGEVSDGHERSGS